MSNGFVMFLLVAVVALVGVYGGSQRFRAWVDGLVKRVRDRLRRQ